MRPISPEALGLEDVGVPKAHALLNESVGWTSLTSYVRVSDLDMEEGSQFGDFQPNGRSTGLFYQDFKQRVLADDIRVPSIDTYTGEWAASRPLKTIESAIRTVPSTPRDVQRYGGRVNTQRQHVGKTLVSLDEMTNTNGDIFDARIRFTLNDAPISPVYPHRGEHKMDRRPPAVRYRRTGDGQTSAVLRKRKCCSDSRIVAPVEIHVDQLRGFTSTGDIQVDYVDEKQVATAVIHKPKLAKRKNLSQCPSGKRTRASADIDSHHTIVIPDMVKSPASKMCKRKRRRLLEQQTRAVMEQLQQCREATLCNGDQECRRPTRCPSQRDVAPTLCSRLPVTRRGPPSNVAEGVPTSSDGCTKPPDDCTFLMPTLLPPTKTNVVKLVKCSTKTTHNGRQADRHTVYSVARKIHLKTVNQVPFSPTTTHRKRSRVPDIGGLSEYLRANEQRNPFQSPAGLSAHNGGVSSTSTRPLESRKITTLGTSNLQKVTCRRRMSFGKAVEGCDTTTTTNHPMAEIAREIDTGSSRLSPEARPTRQPCLGIRSKCMISSEVPIDTLDTICDIKKGLAKANSRKSTIMTNGSLFPSCRQGNNSPRRRNIWSTRSSRPHVKTSGDFAQCRISMVTCV